MAEETPVSGGGVIGGQRRRIMGKSRSTDEGHKNTTSSSKYVPPHLRRGSAKGTSNDRKKKSDLSRQNHSLKLFNIETTQFSNIFHAKICRAAKYKVHAPNCTCSKIEGLRNRFHQYNNKRSLTDKLKDLAMSDPFDNLVVVPDTKTTPAIFVCNETTSKEFRSDARLCETKLAYEIFSGDDNALPKEKTMDVLAFKVSCAACLLTGHQKNGFVAIVSDSAQELLSTLSKARIAAGDAAKHFKLHSDHAHFVFAVKLSSCNSLLQSAKTRSKYSQTVSEILLQLKNGGVDLPSADASCSIQLGHHLSTLLRLQGQFKSKAPERMSQYVMVIGYDDGPSPPKLTLDLPGGKRHLGESTLESLVREVKEECSLDLPREWLSERLSWRYGGALDENSEEIEVLESKKEAGNVYFVIRPWIK